MPLTRRWPPFLFTSAGEPREDGHSWAIYHPTHPPTQQPIRAEDILTYAEDTGCPQETYHKSTSRISPCSAASCTGQPRGSPLSPRPHASTSADRSTICWACPHPPGSQSALASTLPSPCKTSTHPPSTPTACRYPRSSSPRRHRSQPRSHSAQTRNHRGIPRTAASPCLSSQQQISDTQSTARVAASHSRACTHRAHCRKPLQS
mmetsp:Transcript_26367/g.58326  ORF Transcript_26367/g.58326 Transcript_26367/m.58326 type:complete len:205 (-) Transcript_26367:280-894(-)